MDNLIIITQKNSTNYLQISFCLTFNYNAQSFKVKLNI